MAEKQYAPLFLKGIEHFNRGEYFDSHEVWEELWIDERGEDRRFYQGLIQSAVALYHLENGNAVGSRTLVDSSSAYLQSYRSHVAIPAEPTAPSQVEFPSGEVTSRHAGNLRKP